MRIFEVLSILFAMLLAGVNPCAAADSDEQKAVKDLVAKYSAARESRDPVAIDALFTQDADQLPSSGVWRRGRANLVKGMLGSSSRRPGTRTLIVETVRLITPTVALADARYVISGSQGSEPRRMWSTFLARRTSDGWRIAAIRNMLPAR
jgi:uncharacterized protein (TIGR02246 family)